MKKCHKIALLIGLITSVAAIVATVTTVCLLHQKKKKEDEELEHYLDCSIQYGQAFDCQPVKNK